ncbi:putative mitochondrial protein AtMg00310 [Castanea sativa]|uniref:putative mitochondrial protein AtMg00310 n=1 Tax=Castanea sativa TaxID=21020 RepID=UPI003F650B07
MGARVMANCEKYLGLPMVCGKSKVNTFKELQKRITKRVMGWKEKLISKVGREILIKTVAQAIPTYSMCLFKLPNAICDKINSLLSNYWWGQTIGLIGKKLCKDKKMGGMGFRGISAFNLAMLAKQAWRLIHNEQSLFYRVYKGRYFPNCSFLMAELGSNSSIVWRSLLAAREVIREGSMWQIGDGRRIGLTTHKWLPNALAFLHEPNKGMKETLEPPELDKWAITTWSIWNERNSYYFKHVQSQPWWIMESAVGFLNKYQALVAA